MGANGSRIRGRGAEARRRSVAQHRRPVQHRPGRVHRRADRRLCRHRPLGRGREGKPVRACASRKRPTAATRSSCSTATTSSRAGTKTDRRYTSERNVYERALGMLAKERAGERPAARRPAARHRALVPARSLSTASKAPIPAPRSTPATTARRCSRRHPAAARRELADHRARRSSTATPPIDQKLRGAGAHRSRRLVPVVQRSCAAPTTPTRKRGRRSRRPATRSCWRRRACSPIGRRSARWTARSSIRRRPQIKTVELHFTVDRDGRIDNVTSPTTDVPESDRAEFDVVDEALALSRRASRTAPAVPTDDVVFIERVLIKVTSPESGTSSGAEKPAEDSKEPRPEESKPEPKPEAPKPADSPPPACSLIGTASIVRSAAAATASALPGAGASFGVSACEASSGFATSSAGNCVRNFAAASRIAA